MEIKFKKLISILLIISLVIFYVIPPIPIFAEDLSETPVDTSTSQVEAPIPQESPEPIPTEPQNNIQDQQNINTEVDVLNNGEVENNIASDANTGDNTINIDNKPPDATPASELSSDNIAEPTGQNTESTNATKSSEINTNDSVSVSNVENLINSTSVNSNVLYQTINIFQAKNGDINLADPFAVVSDIVSKDKNTEPVINIQVVSNNNYVYLKNEIISISNTGENSINSTGDAVINTGNSYSIVSLLNKVNFTVVDSTLHIITINIFGDLNGNIVLSDIFSSTSCKDCGVSLQTQNNANVENNISSYAQSGQNVISASTSAEIETGDAKSSVGILNIVNSNYLNASMQGIYISTYGTWNGSFLGWGSIDGQSSTLANSYNAGEKNVSYCDTCISKVDVNNTAVVSNYVSSFANTGDNSISADIGKIITGQAFSSVSVINLINTNFIKSFGFFGFINIFGNLTGDIGGKSNFPKANNNLPQNEISTGSSGGEEADGYLDVVQSNNVGDYVLPGDTVTFFVRIKNPSNANVHDTKLSLSLIKDGVNMGGGYFDIGNISPGKQVSVTTGFVLSKDALGGTYTVKAYAEGKTGKNNNTVSASSDSEFNILNAAANLFIKQANASELQKSVLGKGTIDIKNAPAAKDYAAIKMLFLSLVLILLYAALKKTRENPKWAIVAIKYIEKKFIK